MRTLDPKNQEIAKIHQLLLGVVAPRPIAFASTVDVDGMPNLAPFSFFNVFSAHPPILVFSPARSVRDNTTKHTLQNVLATKEVVINVVTYDMVQQMSLASSNFPKGVNEFDKSGLTMVSSQKVRPYRVAESPVQLECVVQEVKALGLEGGAGNLVICEVVMMHFEETVLGVDGGVDPVKIDLVSRMGDNWYGRAKEGLFQVTKPTRNIGMGVDELPESIRNSMVLTGNDIGKLATRATMPSENEVHEFLVNNLSIKKILEDKSIKEIHKFVQQYLRADDLDTAWKILAATT